MGIVEDIGVEKSILMFFGITFCGLVASMITGEDWPLALAQLVLASIGVVIAIQLSNTPNQY